MCFNQAGDPDVLSTAGLEQKQTSLTEEGLSFEAET